MGQYTRIIVTGLFCIFLLVGCGGGSTQTGAENGTNLSGPPVSNQSGGGFQAPENSDATPSFGRQDCPETPASAEKPSAAGAASLPAGSWYKNSDGSLWVGAPAGGAHQGENKFSWVVPAGSQVQVSGLRLDIMTSPMTANLPPVSSSDILTGTLSFPTDGCWQIASEAGGKTIQFILYVAP